MSIALTIERVNGEALNREVPIAGQETYIHYWQPVILQEGYAWLPALLSPGIDLTEEDLPDVLRELRQLQQAVPRYYTPESVGYQRIVERLAGLIEELEALEGKQVELFLG